MRRKYGYREMDNYFLLQVEWGYFEMGVGRRASPEKRDET
jgi:hypothetical protein